MRQGLLTAILVFHALVAGAFGGPPRHAQVSPAQAAIQQALDKQISFSVREYPLGKALRDVSALSGLDIRVDRRALTDLDVTLDEAVTVDLKDVSVRTVLDLMLRDIDCTWIISGDAFLVTTGTEAESILFARFYPVGDLLPRQRSGAPDGKSLIELITAIVAPISWDEVGGPGTIKFTHARGNDALVVVQTFEIHELVSECLSLLRSPRRGHVPTRRQTQDAEVNRALDRTITMSVDDQPLDQVLRRFETTCGLNIEVDQRVLADMEISSNTPVSLHTNGASIRIALERILRPLDLAWFAQRDVLLIAGEDEYFHDRVYDVGDLIWDRRSLELDDEPLINLITTSIAPTSWEEVGGPGAIQAFDAPGIHVFVANQSSEAHEQIAGLLDTLRRIQKDQTDRGRVWKLTSPEDAVEEALERHVSLYFDKSPLAATIIELRKIIGVDVEVHFKGLADSGIAPDVPISLTAADLPARIALQQMLEPIGCVAIPARGIVWITTPVVAEEIQSTRIHDVSNLVANRRAGMSAHQPLLDLITSTVVPTTWEDVGGPASVEPFDAPGIRTLIVSQSTACHAEVENFMSTLLRSSLSRRSGSPFARPPRRAHARSEAEKQKQNQVLQGGGSF